MTPLGLHYLLIHYDIPAVDAGAWRLEVGGRVENELSLSLRELREDWPQETRTVTMECAGNGRARLEPHVVSQPWLLEAVGTAQWTGVLVADLLAEAGVARNAREVLFTGLDRGVEGGVEQSYQRSRCRSTRPTTARCSPTPSTASRCRRSTASRCGWWCRAGTG